MRTTQTEAPEPADAIAGRPAAPCPGADDRAVAVEAVRALARVARILERSAGDLGLAQYRVLSSIAAGEDRAARVAERVWLGRPAVSAAVDALCRDGLVRRAEAAGDQRAVALTVTAAGRAVLDRVEGDMVAVVADLCDRLEPPPTRPGRRRAPSPTLASMAALGPAIDDLLAERRAGRRAGRVGRVGRQAGGR